MARESVQGVRCWWLIAVVGLVIVGAASSAMAQACCRCGSGGGSSCNTGRIPDQATCQQICDDLSTPFGDFQTCPEGMEIVSCSGDAFCDIVCQPAPVGAAVAPATSSAGALVSVVILLAAGGYRLRRRE
jgi:hypothetical protein